MELDRIVSEMVEIPSTPQIIPKIQTLLRDPDSDIRKIIELLKLDVSFSARILRFANSSFFAGAAPANGLDNAIQRIGFREINRLVSITASKDVLNGALSAYNAKEGEMLETSLCCAQLMHSIGRSSEAEAVDAYYAAGLFHGIGKIVIDQYLRKRGLVLYGADALEEKSMEDIEPEIERKVLGFDHAQAGAAFLTSWRFPQAIVEPIRHQIQPDRSTGSYEKITHALHFSRKIAPALSSASAPPETIDAPNDFLEITKLDKTSLIHCVAEAHTEYQLIKSTVLN